MKQNFKQEQARGQETTMGKQQFRDKVPNQNRDYRIKQLGKVRYCTLFTSQIAVVWSLYL